MEMRPGRLLKLRYWFGVNVSILAQKMRKSCGAGNPRFVYRSLRSNVHALKRNTRPQTTQKKGNRKKK
jgi:hypothetical protein